MKGGGEGERGKGGVVGSGGEGMRKEEGGGIEGR
jgi:hypothetical protein